MKTILSLSQRNCINGISKEDAENLKTIPSLDERVTALEQGGSGGNEFSWSEPIIFEKFSELSNVINEYFEYDEKNDDYILKYDTIVVYQAHSNFVPKGFSYFDLYFNFSDIDNPSSSTLRITTYNFNPQEFFFTEPEHDTKFFRNKYKWVISNPTDATFTYDNYSGEELREMVKFYFKNNTNTE